MKAKLNILILFFFFATSVQATSPIRSWSADMYNQPNIKPQEEGSMMRFPVGSVTTEGIEITSNGYENFAVNKYNWTDFSPNGFKYNPKLTPKNTVEKTEESIKNGEYMFKVYCVACHGDDGAAKTPIAKLRGAPPINGVIPKVSEGYLYVRITYGGNVLTSMPPFGYSTSENERWDIVNYIKATFK